MSAMNWQPTPWRRDEWGKILDAQGNMLCVAGVSIPAGHREDDDAIESNSRLLEAAPDLYSALAAIVAAHEECDTMGIGYVLADAARTALAKARGES